MVVTCECEVRFPLRVSVTVHSHLLFAPVACGHACGRHGGNDQDSYDVKPLRKARLPVVYVERASVRVAVPFPHHPWKFVLLVGDGRPTDAHCAA